MDLGLGDTPVIWYYRELNHSKVTVAKIAKQYNHLNSQTHPLWADFF